ncbi:MAG: hypothetical protein JSS30_07880 [Verrucomicrobia bacterium]|nr:hypothetical protein [Verrucomicrobiota bacterium]
MSIRDVSNYLVNNQLDLEQIPQELSREVEESCINLARMDRLKAAGLLILSGTAAIGDKLLMPLAVVIVAFQVADLAASIFLLPLAIIYPLYNLTSSLAGICAGLASFGLYMGYRDTVAANVKNYSDEFFAMAKASWESSKHWYNEADRVATRFTKYTETT